MLAAIVLATSLISTPAPPGKTEAECIQLYPDEWGKIVDCISPPLDLDANPKLKRFFDACRAAAAAAAAQNTEMKSAVIVVGGTEHECTAEGFAKEPGE